MDTECVLAISIILGQPAFISLLLSLPSAWLTMGLEEKQAAWQRIHHAVVHGERDITKLVDLILVEAEQ
jgi:hypothetical protein